MMTSQMWLDLQAQLWPVYGPLIQWWITLFLAGGIALALLVPFIVMLQKWLDDFQI